MVCNSILGHHSEFSLRSFAQRENSDTYHMAKISEVFEQNFFLVLCSLLCSVDGRF